MDSGLVLEIEITGVGDGLRIKGENEVGIKMDFNMSA